LKNLRWKYVWPYLIFGLTIIVLVIANASLIQKSVHQNKKAGAIINIAGRQRLLSQKALTALLLLSRDGSYPPGFKKEVERWNNVHYRLQDPNTDVPGSSMTNGEIRAAFKALAPVQRSLYHELSKTGHDSLVVNRVERLQARYLLLMDKIVSLLQHESELRLLEISNKQVLLAVCSGLVLILEILMLVVPYHRKLIAAYRDLKSQKQLIEDQKEEIEQQVDVLASQNAKLDNLHRTEELTLAGINAGIWNWEIETGNETWSANFYRLLGYEAGELPATFETFSGLLLHPEDIKPVQDAIDAHLKEGTEYKIDIRMKTKDGNYRWYETSGMAARDFEGKPTRMAGSIIDIDDKINYRNRLEISNHAKDKIFAILSHDLRSPLSGIKSLLEMESEIGLTQSEFEGYLTLMKDGVGFAIQTLDDVLVWASAQMNIVTVNARNFKIGDIVAEADQFHRYTAKRKNISITYASHLSFRGYADPNHIFIITRNLIGNAIKFTQQGGRIDILAGINDVKLEVTIRDNGIGMEQSLVTQLLSGRQYVSAYGTDGEKGTGLGINLVLELLQLNKGRLLIESQPGKGSSFTYVIPAGGEEPDAESNE